MPLVKVMGYWLSNMSIFFPILGINFPNMVNPVINSEFKGVKILFGLGKQRSKFGKFLDKNSVSVVEFASESGVNRKTLGKACNDKEFIPRQDVMKKIMQTAKKIDPNIKMSDFWDM